MVHTGIKRPFSRVFIYLLLILLSVAFVFPLVITVSSSLSRLNSLPSILPNGFVWKNYVDAVTLIDFMKYVRNSTLLCVIFIPLATLSSSMAGFAFARLRAPGSKLMFLFITSTMMLPGVVTLIPTYILFYKFGMLDTYLPWLLAGIGGSPYFIFMYRQFFSSIPGELEEAARIDGCSLFGLFWRIFLPLATPATWTAAIILFQWTWGDFITPFMFLKEAHYPLATAMATIGYHPDENVLITLKEVSSAAAILFMLPIVAAFFFGQRFLVDGIAAGGVKG